LLAEAACDLNGLTLRADAIQQRPDDTGTHFDDHCDFFNRKPANLPMICHIELGHQWNCCWLGQGGQVGASL
jgi:hypothetical protein